jgi:16S rRNA U516 pseudouridylate synthase RsuA-like enzyme
VRIAIGEWRLKGLDVGAWRLEQIEQEKFN